MYTAAANSEKLLTRLITDALTKMRGSGEGLFFTDRVFSMQRERAATTNDACRELFIWCSRRANLIAPARDFAPSRYVTKCKPQQRELGPIKPETNMLPDGRAP